ncbi:MAG: Fic family protein [Anaerovorax sp.]
MFREIKKKIIILENRKPYTREILAYMEEFNMVDWIHSSLKLDGSSLSREAVSKILKGELIIDATLDEHMMVERFKQAIRLANNMSDMGTDLNIKCLFQFYEALAAPDYAQYRRSNPVLRTFNYNPPHPYDIEEQMELVIDWYNKDRCDENPILKAVILHNKIIEVYPFEILSETVARMAMNYTLIRNGYPSVGIQMKETDYNNAIAAYIKNEEIQPLYSAIERSIYNKLEVMLQITGTNEF